MTGIINGSGLSPEYLAYSKQVWYDPYSLQLDAHKCVLGLEKRGKNPPVFDPMYNVTGWHGDCTLANRADPAKCRYESYHPMECDFLKESKDFPGRHNDGPNALCVHGKCISESCCVRPKQFQLPVAALVLITILNDGTIISIAYDYVESSKFPESWRLPEVFVVSTFLGSVAVVSSIILMIWGLDSNDEHSTFRKFGEISLPFALCAHCLRG